MHRAADALVVRVLPLPNLDALAYFKLHQTHRFLVWSTPGDTVKAPVSQAK